MPYIEEKDRIGLRTPLENLSPLLCEIGDINYAITKILHDWILRNGICYRNFNQAIGVLECAKLELYRMNAAPYENRKMHENGPVSLLDMKGSIGTL